MNSTHIPSPCCTSKLILRPPTSSAPEAASAETPAPARYNPLSFQTERQNGKRTSLREALSLSQQEADAWERAAKPGALTQIWKQGRAAALVAVVILAVR